MDRVVGVFRHFFAVVDLTVCFSSRSQIPIDHARLADILDPIRELMADVKRKALMRLEYEGDCTMKKDDAAAYAMEKYAYYVCFKCKKVRDIGETSGGASSVYWLPIDNTTDGRTRVVFSPKNDKFRTPICGRLC